MPIPERYSDRRSRPLPRRIYDIVLNRLAMRCNQEPRAVGIGNHNIYRIGDNVYALRVFTRGAGGHLWTNVRPNNLRTLSDYFAVYLAIAFDASSPCEIVLYYISPQLLRVLLQDAYVPLQDYGQWSLHLSPENDGGIRIRCGRAVDHLVAPDEVNRFERLNLTDEESEIIQGFIADEVAAQNAEDDENAGEL